jgi:hypothetical protein
MPHQNQNQNSILQSRVRLFGKSAQSRVARWFLFKPKNPNLGKFILEGLRLENVDMFCGHLEYFTDIWDIL